MEQGLAGEIRDRGWPGAASANSPIRKGNVAAHEELPAEVADWEPRDALVAGPSGLEAVAELVEAAPVWLWV